MIYTYQQHLKSRLTNIYFFLCFGGLFIFNPLLSIFCSGIWLIIKNKPDETDVKFWLALLALWISLVNLTKVPESDQVMYLKMFSRYSEHDLWSGIFNYTNKPYKEPVYGLYQYICYYSFLGNSNLFFLLTSFLSYWLLFQSVNIILTNARFGITSVIFGVVCCTFFNQFFYVSIHLIRQILAFSIVVYAIALKTQDGKNHWILLISAALIHTTAMLFAFLALLPYVYHRMNIREYLILSIPLLIITVGSFAFGTMMTSILGENSTSGYAFKRLSTDFEDGLKADPIVVAIMLAPLSIIAIIALYRLSRSYISSLYPIIYIFLFLAIMILSLSARPLMQYRFVFVTYQLMPFLLPILLPHNSKWRNPYYLVIGSLFILRFFITLPHSSWIYNVSPVELLYWPVPLYFLAS